MVPKIKKILYATDLSENSAFAYLYATDLAEKHDAKIVILHVLEQLPSGARVVLSSYLTDEQRENLFHRKAETAERIKKRLAVFCDKVHKEDPECAFRVESIEVSEGFPAEEILEKAREIDCDLIVLGTHGKGMVSHAFLGSVAEKVLKRAKSRCLSSPCPEERWMSPCTTCSPF